MSWLDLAIVGMIAIGLVAGWSRGLLRPLVGEAGFAVIIAVLYLRPDLLALVAPSGVARVIVPLALVVITGTVLGTIGGRLLRLAYGVRHVPALDRAVGAVAHGLFATAAVYLALLGLGAVDGALAPLHCATALDPGSVAAVRSKLAADPNLAALDDDQLLELQQASASAPLPLSALGRYDAPLAYYEFEVRPQLVSSRLASALLDLGGRIPVLGRTAATPVAVDRVCAPAVVGGRAD